MRNLISIDFPAPKMEPESAHVVSAVSAHWLQCGDCNAARPRQHTTSGPLLSRFPSAFCVYLFFASPPLLSLLVVFSFFFLLCRSRPFLCLLAVWLLLARSGGSAKAT